MKLLLAGGGTAGHIEPALAVVRAWQRSHPSDSVVFIGTSSGLENTLVPAAGFELINIPKVGIPRTLSPSLFLVPFRLLQSVAATAKILRTVDCAIGFGGYVSGPLYLAAAITGKPFVIHEQNARPGWANRMGSLFTRYTAVSYPVRRGRLSKAELTGLPLRADVLAVISRSIENATVARQDAKNEITTRFGLKPNQPLIFIFGGSQGSQAINKVIEGFLPYAKGISILHGVGKNNKIPPASETYKALSYIEEMAQCYLAADLLIARSGAVTCAEATALSKYSLFVPLPIGNGEQELNADSLVKSGRATVIAQSEFTPDWLANNISSLIEKSAAQSNRIESEGQYAADKIVKLIERAAKIQ